MRADKLMEQILEKILYEPDCPVFFQNTETGEIFSLLGVTYETDDEGATLFIHGQPT